ncbi:MAG: hypothetical protein ACT4QF_16280 [Sporichthyaceae bacterium]
MTNQGPMRPMEPPGGGLTDEECRTLMSLLARYCWHHLDQWENWRVGDAFSDVYLTVTRGLPDGGWEREHFTTVWPPDAPDAARYWKS